MLPPGDWHCPNCVCKVCGIASENVAEEDETTVSALLACSLCGKKCTHLLPCLRSFWNLHICFLTISTQMHSLKDNFLLL